MNIIAVLACEQERIARIKWYSRKPYKIIERFILEDFSVEAAIFYFADQKALKHLPKLLSEYGAVNAVCTEKFIERFGTPSVEGVNVADGKYVFRRLVPALAKKAFKLSGIEGRNGTLAVCEDDAELAHEVIEALCNDFRYITIVTSHKKRSSALADRFLDEHGLPIVVADSRSKLRCDLAVKTGVTFPNLSNNTILIDAAGENTITRKKMINWADITLPHTLPFKIDSLALAECIERSSGRRTNVKICGFRCNKESIKTSALCRP